MNVGHEKYKTGLLLATSDPLLCNFIRHNFPGKKKLTTPPKLPFFYVLAPPTRDFIDFTYILGSLLPFIPSSLISVRKRIAIG